MRRLVFILIFLLVLTAMGESAIVCGNDTDGDGTVDNIQDCIQGTGGYICPIDRVECTEELYEPVCPQGYQFNSSTGKCEMNPCDTCNVNAGGCTPATCNVEYQAVIDSTVYLTTRNTSIRFRDYNFVDYFTGGYSESPNSGVRILVQSNNGNPWIRIECRSGNAWISGNNVYLKTGGQSGCYISGFLSDTYYAISVSNGKIKFGTKSSFSFSYTWSNEIPLVTCCDPARFNWSANCCCLGDPSMCIKDPTCSQGSYDPVVKKCRTQACPYGSAYPCIYTSSDRKYWCSKLTCIDNSNQSNIETENADLTGYTNDGQVDPNTGQCLGQILIFNGRPGECRPKGTQTGFHNCCECQQDANCKNSELTVSCAVKGGTAHYIGEYCKEKWKFIGCVQKAKVYCVFSSKFGRIVQEQGRPQLTAFQPDGAWGDPKNLNCRGFKPEEFQMLDFSKIDLSEWINDVSSQMQQKAQELQGTINQSVQQQLNEQNVQSQ